MRVSVHPNRHKYLAGEDKCVSVTRTHKGRQHTTYAKSVFLRDATLRVQPAGVARAQREGVRNVHAWAVGFEIVSDIYDLRPLGEDYKKVTYHFNSGEFRILATGENVTGMTFPYAYIIGRDFYILDNRSK
jgi:hypothetical protein